MVKKVVKKKTSKVGRPPAKAKKAAPVKKRHRRTKAEMEAARAAEAAAKGQAPKLSVQDAILAALDRILELAKAQLLDAFRSYIEHKLKAEKPASLEEFVAGAPHTIGTFGIKDEDLVAALSEDQREYLLTSAKAQEKVAAPLKQEAPAKPSGVVVENGHAEKLNAQDFGVSEPAKEAPAKEAPKQTSVFSELDVL